jgi:glycerate-2-kinase
MTQIFADGAAQKLNSCFFFHCPARSAGGVLSTSKAAIIAARDGFDGSQREAGADLDRTTGVRLSADGLVGVSA